MATPIEMAAKIAKVEVNMDRLNLIVNGDATTDVPTDVGPVPSITKFYQGLDQQINGEGTGILADVTALKAQTQTLRDEAEGFRDDAEAIAGSVTGVGSFNGRTGSVVPVAGDYTAAQVTYLASDVGTALDTLNAAQDSLSANLKSNVSTLALAVADLSNQLIRMKGGIVDAFDGETGVNRGAFTQGIDSDTVSLFHFDGLNGKVVLKDEGWSTVYADVDQPFPWSSTGSTGMSIDTSQSKFGGSSMRFSGAGSGYFFRGVDASNAHQFSGSDFTVDFWVRFNAVGGGVQSSLIEWRSSTGVLIYVTTTGVLAVYHTDGNYITGTTALTTGVWYHIALQRIGTQARLFLNGVQEGGTYTMGTGLIGPAGVARPFIGADTSGTNILNGWIDELRFSKVARWTTFPFTPPTAAYQGPTGTTTAKQIYDAIGALYRPAERKTLIAAQAFGTVASVPERSQRVLIPARRLGASGTYARFRLDMGTAVMTIKQMYVGQKAASGNAWDFAASPAPVQATFNGGQTTLAYAGVPVWTDWLLLNLDNTKDYLTAVDATASSAQAYSTFANDQAVYSKNGTQLESNALTPSGYSVIAGQSNGVDLIQVKADTTTSEVMLLESITFTATSAPSRGRVTVQVDGASPAITPNTDLVAEMSRDGGSTWTTVPLALSLDVGAIRHYEAEAALTSTTGTSIKYRVKTPTGKAIKVTGVAASWA